METDLELEKLFDDFCTEVGAILGEKGIISGVSGSSSVISIQQLRDEGRITASDVTCLEILAKDKLGPVIEKYQNAYKQKFSGKSGFFGREAEINEIMEIVAPGSEEVGGVCVVGAAGVGKTCLCLKLMSILTEEEGRTLQVCLKGVKRAREAYGPILRAFLPCWFDLQDAKVKILDIVTNNLEKFTILLVDDVEADLFKDEEFMNFLNMLCGKDQQLGVNKLAVLVTAREFPSQISSEFLHRKHLGPLQDGEAVSLASGACMHEQDMRDLIQLCDKRPYMIKTTAGAVKDKSVKIADLKEKMNELQANPQSMAMKANLPGTWKLEPFEFVHISTVFSSLQPEIRKNLVCLSVFPQQFTIADASKIVFQGDESKCGLVLHELSSYRALVEYVHHKEKFIKSDSFESLKSGQFQLHGILQDFLEHIRDTQDYEPLFQKTNEEFFNHYSMKLQETAQLMETNFVECFNRFELDRPNFELILKLMLDKQKISFASDYRNTGAIADLLKQMIQNPQQQQKLFDKWALEAEREGDVLCCCDLLCQKAWQILKIPEVTATLEILETVKDKLCEYKKTSGDSEHLRLSTAMYQFTLGKLCMEMSNQSDGSRLKLLKRARSAMESSMLSRQQFLGAHAHTIRAAAELGSIYYRLNEFGKSLRWLEEALSMRLSKTGEDFYDVPELVMDVAAVHEALKDFSSADKYYREALIKEKNLKIDGYKLTASINRNRAYCLYYMKDPELKEARECAEKALKIRRKLTEYGLLAKTMLAESLYQCGYLEKESGPGRDLKKSWKFFEEAIQLENTLTKPSRDAERLKNEAKKVLSQLKMTDVELKKISLVFKYSPDKKKKALLSNDTLKKCLNIDDFCGDEITQEHLLRFFQPFFLDTIDKGGKTITHPEAGVTITIPKGAVKSSCMLKWVVKKESMPQEDKYSYLCSNIVQLETIPEQDFDKQVMITLWHSGQLQDHVEVVVMRKAMSLTEAKHSTWNNVDHFKSTIVQEEGHQFPAVEFSVKKLEKWTLTGDYAVILRPKQLAPCIMKHDGKQQEEAFQLSRQIKVGLVHPVTTETKEAKVTVQTVPVDQIDKESVFFSPLVHVTSNPRVEIDQPFTVKILLPFGSLPRWFNVQDKSMSHSVLCSQDGTTDDLGEWAVISDVHVNEERKSSQHMYGVEVKFESSKLAQFLCCFKKCEKIPQKLKLHKAAFSIVMWAMVVDGVLDIWVAADHMRGRYNKCLGKGTLSKAIVCDGNIISVMVENVEGKIRFNSASATNEQILLATPLSAGYKVQFKKDQANLGSVDVSSSTSVNHLFKSLHKLVL